MTVGVFCNREVVTTHQGASLTEVAQLMREYHVGSIIVVDEIESGVKPIGIITDRDIVIEVIAPQLSADSLTVRDVMSYDLVTANESDGIWETMQTMRARGIRRIPVVDNYNHLIGILSADDLTELLAGELNDLVRIDAQSLNREETIRTKL